MTILWWVRRDMRLRDNPVLEAATAAGAAVQAIYVHAPEEDAPWEPGAASNWWLRESLKALDQQLRQRGGQLLVVQGRSDEQLCMAAQRLGCTKVYWNRLYEPHAIRRDKKVAAALQAAGLEAQAFPGHLLWEPHQVRKADGSAYRVFTPFWKAAQALGPPAPPRYSLTTVDWVAHTEAVTDWPLIAEFRDEPWHATLAAAWTPGEVAAQQRLATLADAHLKDYAAARDIPSRDVTSRLSPHLHFGEVSPSRVWQATGHIRSSDGVKFHAELGWREFAHHLLWHFPDSTEVNFNRRFDNYPWRQPDPDDPDWKAWAHGRTGIPIVDAGMRQLWNSGWMHNRVRMLVGSLLTKNLNIHWQYGARWFWDTLVDADLASNTLGWQWVAGSGADAAPFFRIFNPLTQAEKFDPSQDYVRQWRAQSVRRQPIVDLKHSRAQALANYKAHCSG
ncbi:MAG: deoxyribodipyrimidine photo-lyase [Oceanococcaceae bacterium]